MRAVMDEEQAFLRKHYPGSPRYALELDPAFYRKQLARERARGRGGERLLGEVRARARRLGEEARAREFLAQIRAEGVRGSIHQGNIGVGDDCRRVVREVIEEHGSLDILIATPGRLIDHLESGAVRFGEIEMLVLDEADRMLDMGFIEPIEHIAAALPSPRQTLMFSATFAGPVGRLAAQLMKPEAQRVEAYQALQAMSAGGKLAGIDPERRKDAGARRELLNSVDVAILCLPDDAAKEAVAMIDPASKTRVIDASTDHFVFEITGRSTKIEQFIQIMTELGLTEVSRTGIAAIGRGPASL